MMLESRVFMINSAHKNFIDQFIGRDSMLQSNHIKFDTVKKLKKG